MDGSATTTQASINLLGGFSVVADGREVPAPEWRRRHAAALVKVLALTPGRSMHRERLIDLIWPGVDLEAAAPRLHKAAHYARRSLGDRASLVLRDEAVSLYPDAAVKVDALRFESSAQAALDDRDRQQALAAADQYAGDLLPDDLYEPWTEEPRERLRMLHLGVLRLAGRWQVLVAADPTDEEAHLELMRLLAGAGDRRSALRQFERLERELSRELGVAPSPAAIRLRDALAAAVDGTATPEAPPSRGVLVGRDSERARGAEVLELARRGSGQVLFVSGAAGVGKSALLDDVASLAAGQRMRIGRGAAARIAGNWPYAPVLEALSDLCRRHPALLDGLDDRFREQIERALSGRQYAWDGEGTHQRLFVATTELLRLAAAGAGAVILVDDAHDADEASLRLLHYLVRSIRSERVLVVVGHRPVRPGVLAEVRASLLGRPGGTALEVGPLGRDDCLRLARRHAPAAAATVLEALYQASAGLPFVISELARAWSADPDTDTRALWLPAGLSARAQAALADAAVLGSSLDTDEFAAVTGLSEEDVYAVLDEAVARRVLTRTEAGYLFRHALIREALLDAAGQRDRRGAHARAAHALQELGGSPARIGYHLVQAGELGQAVPWMIRAGETEAALGAYRDALAQLETVAAVARGEDRARLLALRADLLSACGDRSAIDAYRAALSVAAQPEAQVRLRTGLARAATFVGDLEMAELALADVELDGGENDAAILLVRGHLAYFRHDFAAADEAAAQARRRIGLGESQDQRLFDLVALQGLLAHHRGQWFQRLRLEMRNGMSQPMTGAIFDSHLCVAEYLLYGPTPYDEVLRLAAELRDTAERAGVLRAVAFATALRGEAALLKGDLELAENELLDAADLHRDLASPAGEAHSLQRLAEVHLAHGDRATATELLQRALPLARWSTVGLHLLQRIYGSMIAAAPDPDVARAVVDRAEAALGREDQCAFCSIMWAVPAAQACADVGDLGTATTYLEVAQRSEALWEGTAWQAHLLEVRAHIENAQSRFDEMARLMDEAAAVFAAAGQPMDAARCRAGLTPPATPVTSVTRVTPVTPGRV